MPEKTSVVDDIFDEIQRLKKEKEEAEKANKVAEGVQPPPEPVPDYYCKYSDTVTINGLKYPVVKPYIRRDMP